MANIFEKMNNLVVDLGMNNGDDTEYYLKKGYRVVAVEANPVLCSQAQERFCRELGTGQLKILNVAIWSNYDKKNFFVNLDNNHWSSLDVNWAGRENSHCTEILVDCVPLSHIFSQFGIPYYLKVDVEGADELVIDQLKDQDRLPYYLSVEDCRFGYKYMAILSGLGYSKFKLLDQSLVPEMYDKTIDYTFKKGSSGSFGEDLQGEWFSYFEIEERYSREVRDRTGNRIAPMSHWWDIHCKGD